jgi:hypothetical protein
MSLLVDIIIKFLTLLSIVAGIYTFYRGAKNYDNQMNAQVFLQYAKRYDEIMNSFPKSARLARINSNKALPKQNGELTVCALRYFNLCSEEFYLYQSKYLSQKVWDIWRDEMIRTWRTPLFRREWVKLVDEFDAYSEFQSFVNNSLE